MDICFATDDRFGMLTGVSVLSLLENNRGGAVHIYVLDDGISAENKVRLETVVAAHPHSEISFIDVREKLRSIVRTGQRAWGDFPSYATWARLFLPELLPQTVERLLYLDGDTVVEGPLQELYDTDLQGHTIAAVEDCVAPASKQAIGLPPDIIYVNAGVLLFDIKKWRRSYSLASVFSYLNSGKQYFMADQDVLNLMFAQDCLKLPLKYNYSSWYRALSPADLCALHGCTPLFSYSNEEIEACGQGGAVIYHYNTSSLFIRPWYTGASDPEGARWHSYYDKSPWKDAPLEVEPDRLTRGERHDRLLYKLVGKRRFIRVHQMDMRLRSFLRRVFRWGRKPSDPAV